MKPRPLLTMIALVCAALVLLGADQPAVVTPPVSVTPPCFVPSRTNTGGWQLVAFPHLPYAYRIPQDFKLDSSAGFEHGGIKWKKGLRSFEQSRGYWGEYSFGLSEPSWCQGYSECVDTLAGAPWRLITTYNSNYRAYVAVAVPAWAASSRRMTHALIGMSPDSADVALFLAIFRTLRVDSTAQMPHSPPPLRRVDKPHG